MQIKIIIDDCIKTRENKCLKLFFSYNKNLIEFIKSQKIRYWHPDGKFWELPYSSLEYLKECEELSDFQLQIIECGSVPEIFKPDIEIKDHSNKHEFKTTPRSYQKDGFNYGMCINQFLLADEPGLGKSFQSLNIALGKKKNSAFKHCLIIVCVNSLKLNWRKEVEKHTNEKCFVLGQRINRKGDLVVDGNAKKLEQLEKGIDEFFIVTNLETLRDENISDQLHKMCISGEIGMIICDEAHFCRNPNTQQSKGLLRLQSKYKIAMTGTPLVNKLEDLYIILKWLGQEKNNFWNFKNHYCVYGGFGGHEIIAYKNKNEIIQKLNKCMLRRKKSEVLDLPPINEIPVYVEMTKEEWSLYSEVKSQIKQEIDLIKLSPNPLAKLIRLRQVTALSLLLSSKAKHFSKLSCAENIIDECVSNDEKVVVFFELAEVAEYFYKQLKRFKPALIIGKISKDSDRFNEIQRFENDPECKVIIGTTKALGTGFDLVAGNNVIFVEEPWAPAHKEQARDRSYRIGTTKTLNVYTLICENTMDEVVHEIIENKSELSSFFVDGEIKNREYTNKLLTRILE